MEAIAARSSLACFDVNVFVRFRGGAAGAAIGAAVVSMCPPICCLTNEGSPCIVGRPWPSGPKNPSSTHVFPWVPMPIFPQKRYVLSRCLCESETGKS